MIEGIIKTQAQAWVAPRALLDATHAALTGEPFPQDVSDDAARVRVTMLILLAKDHAEPGECSVSAVLRKGVMMKNQYKEGTLAAQLSAQIKPESVPRERLEPPARQNLKKIRALAEGRSKMQRTSLRYAIHTHIRAAGEGGITIEELDKLCGVKTAGHVQKLAAAGWVEAVQAVEPSDEQD